MKKLVCLAVVSALLVVGFAFAGDVSKGCGKSKGKSTASSAGCSKAASLTADASGVCPKTLAAMVDKVMNGMPRMIYLAGDSKTVCFKTAVKRAGCESKVGYQVANKPYECKQSASEALASLLEDHARQIMTVQYMLDGQRLGCAKTAAKLAADESNDVVYRLAGVDFTCSEKAKAAAEAVRQAVIELAASNPRAAEFVKANYAGNSRSQKRQASGCSKGASAKLWSKGGCSKSRSGDSASQVNVASGTAGCSKSAATVASDSPKSGCGSKAKVAVASASAGSGCCSKKAKVVAGKAEYVSGAVATKGCSKGKPATASGIVAGGCVKSKAAVVSDDAKGGCCSKVKAALASVVAATKGCCSKTATTVAAAKTGCGSKSASACSKECAGKCDAACTTACAKATASAATSGCCSKGQSVSADKAETSEERLANIQNLLRVMVETAARNSLS